MKTSWLNKKVGSTIVVVFVACLVVLAFYSSRDSGKYIELDSGHRMVMGTFARVVVIAKDTDTAGKCIESAFMQINKVDDLMSDYKDDSEISRLNRDGFKKRSSLASQLTRFYKEALNSVNLPMVRLILPSGLWWNCFVRPKTKKSSPARMKSPMRSRK